MAVGDAENLQDALQRAVLAGPAMQDIERDIGLEPAQHRRDITAGIDGGDAIADAGERIGAGFARTQRDLALGRPASHQNGDMLSHRS